MSKQMRGLIKQQTLRLENHKRADGQGIIFGSGVHVHKVMNSDKYSGAEVLIPLDRDEEIKFIKIKGGKKIENRLRSEINKAFKDRKKRTDFVEDVLQELQRKCTYPNEREKLESFLLSSKRIASHFGLVDVNNPIVRNTTDIFETMHTDEEGNIYYLLQDIKGNNIRIGDSKDIVENWDDIGWG